LFAHACPLLATQSSLRHAILPGLSQQRCLFNISLSFEIHSAVKTNVQKYRNYSLTIRLYIVLHGGKVVRCFIGRVKAQAVSRQLPIAAAWVRTQVKSCGMCGGQRSTEVSFLSVLRLPLPILVPPTAPHSSGAGTIGQLAADVPSGLSLTPPHETRKN
jgi:hypothetical protein